MARLTRTQLHFVLKRAGRQRGIEADADRLQEVFCAEWTHSLRSWRNAPGPWSSRRSSRRSAGCVFRPAAEVPRRAGRTHR